MDLLKGNEILNPWFIGVLWLKIVFSSLALIGSIIGQIEADFDWWFFIDAVLMMSAIGGAYLLTQANKIGFYLMVSTNVIMAVICWVKYINFDTSEYGMFATMASQKILQGVWSSIGHILLLLLLMLLPHNGKNVYQILWKSKQ